MTDVHPKHYKCQHKAQEDQPTQILHSAFFLQGALPTTKPEFDLPVLHPTQNYPNRRNLPEADWNMNLS